MGHRFAIYEDHDAGDTMAAPRTPVRARAAAATVGAAIPTGAMPIALSGPPTMRPAPQPPLLPPLPSLPLRRGASSPPPPRPPGTGPKLAIGGGLYFARAPLWVYAP
jgi:hypothetical protein